MRIYLGCSAERTDDEVLEMLDIDPTHPDGVALFQLLFGASYLAPGTYEVYGNIDVPGDLFTPDWIRKLVPFHLDEPALFHRELSQLRSVFFVQDEVRWRVLQAAGIEITDVLEMDGYNFD